MKIGIFLDEWKLPTFKRRLTAEGYKFKKGPGVAPGTVSLHIESEDLPALNVLIKDINEEAARSRAGH